MIMSSNVTKKVVAVAISATLAFGGIISALADFGTGSNNADFYARQLYAAASASASATPSAAPSAGPIIPSELKLVADYSFNSNIKNAVTGKSAALVGNRVEKTATSNTPAFVDGVNGKSYSITGDTGNGLKLDVIPSTDKYAISFDMKLNASTQFTSALFIGKSWADANAQWISIAPQGHLDVLTKGPMIWARDVVGNTGVGGWHDTIPAASSQNTLKVNTWTNVKVVADKGNVKLYVNDVLVATGTVPQIMGSGTSMFIGVNAWDTAFDGAIQNLKVYAENSINVSTGTSTVAVSSIKGIPAKATLYKGGKTLTLKGTVSPTNATVKTVTYSSSKKISCNS